MPGSEGHTGRPAEDNRRFINAVFWILRTGAPWRDLPPEYGGWKNTHRRFSRWRDKGIWEKMADTFANADNFMKEAVDIITSADNFSDKAVNVTKNADAFPKNSDDFPKSAGEFPTETADIIEKDGKKHKYSSFEGSAYHPSFLSN